jgi:hypothetical protein
MTPYARGRVRRHSLGEVEIGNNALQPGTVLDSTSLGSILPIFLGMYCSDLHLFAQQGW